MTDRDIMQQALEALEQVAEYFNADSTEAKTIIALRKRLVQPDPSAYWHNEFLKHNTTSEQPAQQQEPVAVARVDDLERGGRVRALAMGLSLDAPLYTAPPHRKPLTDEEIDKLPWEPHEGNPMTFAEGLRYFARAIEAAHGITGEQHE